MAGAGDAGDRARAVPGAAPGPGCGWCCRRSARAVGLGVLPAADRGRRHSARSACACRATPRRCAGSTASAASSIGRRPRSPTRSPPTPRPGRAGAVAGACRARALSARKLRAGWPSPRLSLRDPIALRALVLILVVATFIAAGGERWKRVAAAFDWHGVVAPANFRVDAWVNPPAYTGRPPVMLTGLRRRDRRDAQRRSRCPPAASWSCAPPAMCISRSRAKAASTTPRRCRQARRCRPAPRSTASPSRATAAHPCTACSAASTSGRFKRHPRPPPTIAFTKDPERQARGALRARLPGGGRLRRRRRQGDLRAQGHAKPPAQHPLYGPPEFPLTLPQPRTRSGAAQTTRDLTEHPWAGAEVTVTLTAKDEAGNEGQSEPRELTLPRAHLHQAARARADRAAAQSRARCRRQADRAHRARCADAWRRKSSRPKPASISACARSITISITPRATTSCARWWRGCGTWRVQIEDGNVSQAEQALRQAQENAAPGARARRQRRGNQEADGGPARRHGQVHAGAGRGDAQESAAAVASARPQHAHAEPAGSQEHARPAGEPGALGQPRGGAAVARSAAVDAGEPADGASRRLAQTRATTT